MFLVICFSKCIDFFIVDKHPCYENGFKFTDRSEAYRKMLARLKSRLESYRDVDKRITALNAEVHTLRNDRKVLEVEMADILRDQQFHTFNEVRLSDDGSVIKIQRPNQWSKAWTLSKKDLHAYLKEYFESTRTPNADECFNMIVDKKTKALVATEFAFTHTPPE